MQKILLDTNFLLVPGQFGVDIFSELERICDFTFKLCVLDKTLDELKSVQQQGGKDKAAAILGLKLVDAKKLQVLDTKTATFKKVDQIILELAPKEGILKEGFIVATNDGPLKSRLKQLKVRVVTLRQKKFLQLE